MYTKEEMRNLVNELNKASDAYYNGNEIMSNFEFDEKMGKLEEMEKELGVLPDSPSINVGYAVKVDALKKVTHRYPALSLDKTKDIDELVGSFSKAMNSDTVLMWKMDGSTINLVYKDGKLVLASTRGNGEIGQDITHNAPFIKGICREIPYKDDVYIRGEAVMTYTEFNRINNETEEGQKFTNPRNLANATVSMIDSREMRKREIQFYAFSLVAVEGMEKMTFEERLRWIEAQGIQTVPYKKCDISSLKAEMTKWGDDLINKIDYPVDGLVVALNDAPYADTLPGTDKHPNTMRGYAFKWQDEEAQTTLCDIEWQVGRTGVLTPVAVFDPVELEGTTVTKATLHNFSYMRKMALRKGNKIAVIKANKIIPQVVRNLSEKEEYADSEVEDLIGRTCPVCGATLTVRNENGVETVHCLNKNCAAKRIKALVHFGERDCMNLVGMSDSIISRFVEKGYLKEFSDFYKLDRYRDEIVQMEGFGEKSWEKIWKSIQDSRHIDFIPFIHSLGIPNIGKGQAKLLSRHFHGDFEEFLASVFNNPESDYDYTVIDGFGDILSRSLNDWTHYMLAPMMPNSQGKTFEDRQMEMTRLFEYVSVNLPEKKDDAGSGSKALEGKTFVITGSVEHFKNRDAIREFIEANGGKSSGSVSSKTSYLINNDVTSTSGKNKKAKELGIPIISEETLLHMVG